MSYADQKAAILQEKVRSEAQDQHIYYEDIDIRKAIVHAREDIVMLVSHLSSVNRHLWRIKTALLGILIVLIYIAVKTN